MADEKFLKNLAGVPDSVISQLQIKYTWTILQIDNLRVDNYMIIWKLRNFLTDKLNIAALKGRHSELQFSDSKVTILPGVEFDNPPTFSWDQCALFLHIPKTAGTTVIAILEAQMLEARKCYKRSVIREYHPTIAIIPGWQGAWSDIQDHHERFSNADLISGHFPFGVHTLLNRESHYFTLVRDPVAREVSTYNYLFQTGAIEKNEPFQSFTRRLVDNPQVRMIAGHEYMSGPCNQDIYDKAIQNLHSYFSLYGPSERTDEILNVLISMFGLMPVAYSSFNVTKRKLIAQISDELNTELKEKHQWDQKLHQYAEEHWSRFTTELGVRERLLDPDQPVLEVSKDFSKNKLYSVKTFSEL